MGLLDPARLGSGILCTPLDHHVDCPIAINDYGDSDDDDDDVEEDYYVVVICSTNNWDDLEKHLEPSFIDI